MIKEAKIISKDILKLFLICGSLVLLILVIPILFYGAKWALSKALSKYYIIIYYIIISGSIIILIAGLCASAREYWKDVKKRAKKDEP